MSISEANAVYDIIGNVLLSCATFYNNIMVSVGSIANLIIWSIFIMLVIRLFIAPISGAAIRTGASDVVKKARGNSGSNKGGKNE